MNEKTLSSINPFKIDIRVDGHMDSQDTKETLIGIGILTTLAVLVVKVL